MSHVIRKNESYHHYKQDTPFIRARICISSFQAMVTRYGLTPRRLDDWSTNQLTPPRVTEVHDWSISKTQCPESVVLHVLVSKQSLTLHKTSGERVTDTSYAHITLWFLFGRLNSSIRESKLDGASLTPNRLEYGVQNKRNINKWNLDGSLQTDMYCTS